jgi:predicted ATPase/transcriptional regulator with XRE-family HTH domain
MPSSDPVIPLESFPTFGDLLKYLRRRARLTQRELSIAVGYSEAQISRLEQNQRPPDLASLAALFIPALDLNDAPLIVNRLMELAAQTRGEELPRSGVVTISRFVQREVGETVRTVEEETRNNLPLQLTSFIGREHEMKEIKNLLGFGSEDKQKYRLVTLTGPGGCGKTRLALETAKQLVDSYRDGIWLIEFASISDPNLALSTVTSTLGIPETRTITPISALTKNLRTKQLLLIFDNCEQILTATTQLAEEILHACGQVQILVTSREIFNAIGEVQFRVPPLSLSKGKSSHSDISSLSESAQLFVERAQAVLPSFTLTEEGIPVVTQICQLVDGMPLGIELAAAKISVLSVGQIATRLNDSFQLLSRSRADLPHHQTLEATIQWSYDLLSDAERLLMQRVSVFSGGWTLEAAEAVTSEDPLIPREKVLDLLSQLINKSLVVVGWHLDADTRYTMLQMIHEFAYGKLHETGKAKHMRIRHFDYFFSLAQEARLFGNEKGKWLDCLEAEHDNLRSALAWSLETGEIEKGTELILPILDFYWFRGYSTEAREWMDKFLKIELPASHRRAFLLQKAGWLTRASGDFEKADVLLKRSLKLAFEIGDKNRAAWAMMDLGLSARDQGDHERAVSYFSQALTFAQESGEKRAIGICLYNLAESYDISGELDTSRKLWEQGLDVLRLEGDQTHIAWGLEGLAGTAYLAKDFSTALRFHLESLQFKVGVMDKLGIAYSFEGLAQVSAAQGESERAAILWGAANSLREALNVPIEPSRENMYTSLIPITRAQFGDKNFDHAWKKGKTMSLKESIEFALRLPDN